MRARIQTALSASEASETGPRVVLVEHDPSWAEQFAAERDVLVEVLGSLLVGAIEHVGSTAVPGLLAKPIIDIMVGVESLEASRPILPILEQVGYVYFPYRAEVMHWFCKPSPSVRTHHVHAVPFEGPLWRERLAFRDTLRCRRDLAEQYAALKRRLAERHHDDREAYTAAKTDFVLHVLAQA